MIDKISHLSSVSGGSLAASYYVLKKLGKAVPVLEADGSLSEAYKEFFARYRTDLSQDIEGAAKLVAKHRQPILDFVNRQP
jgi:hypothetical protein